MMIVFQGPVITDTHQQYCELARIELEFHGDAVHGRFAAIFCLWGGVPCLTADGYQPFTGRVIERLKADLFVVELYGHLRCHHFDCTTLIIEARGRRARICGNTHDHAVTLSRGPHR